MNKALFIILLGYNILIAGSAIFLGYAFVFPKFFFTFVIAGLIGRLSFKRRMLVLLPETIFVAMGVIQALMTIHSLGPNIVLLPSFSITNHLGGKFYIKPEIYLQLTDFVSTRWDFLLNFGIFATIVMIPLFYLPFNYAQCKFIHWVMVKKSPKIRGIVNG